METKKHAAAQNFQEQFKSYYVVWKPTSGRKFRRAVVSLNRTMQYGNLHVALIISRKCIWFKSYYVVWKHYIAPSIFTPFPQFKSYYVVWKHNFSTIFGFFVNSLNRTMQYGNIPHQKAVPTCYLCLNRTMQYGNSRVVGTE